MPAATATASNTFDTRQGLEAIQLRVALAWMEYTEHPEAFNAYQLLTREWSSNALVDRLVSFGPGPKMKPWTDQKEFERFRVFDFTVGMLNYHKGIELDMNDVRYDPSGALAEKIARWVGTMKEDIGYLTHQARQMNSGAGPVCFDGQNLYSASHPFSPSPQSNVTSANLSYAAFETAMVAMQSYVDEKGNSMGISPTVLEVGPKNGKIARQICNAHDRVVTVDANGGQDVVASVLAASTMANVWQGDCTVLINPQLVGTLADRWYLHDLSKPGARPMGFKLNMSSKLTEKTDDKDGNVFHANKGLWSITLDGTPHADYWPVTYGGGISL